MSTTAESILPATPGGSRVSYTILCENASGLIFLITLEGNNPDMKPISPEERDRFIEEARSNGYVVGNTGDTVHTVVTMTPPVSARLQAAAARRRAR